MMEEKKIWGIHTLDDNLFLNRSVIAIGWKNMGDLSKISPDREAFKEKLKEADGDIKEQAIPTAAGMLYRFTYEIKIGDYVVFPSKINREINIGEIVGDYEYVANEPHYRQMRKVKWLRHLPRTVFSQGALYEVGSALTLFQVKNYADEYMRALGLKAKDIEIIVDEKDVVEKTAEDIIESTKDFLLKELSKKMKGYDLENFVADLLTAMGYRTTLSPHGGDRGIDIVAYKDELPPRIVVQVKSCDCDIKESLIQSLKGALHTGDYGLFVTLSNYTKNAQKYLQENPIIRGINGSELADLIVKYYDGLSDESKKIIPLKKVFIPISKE